MDGTKEYIRELKDYIEYLKDMILVSNDALDEIYIPEKRLKEMYDCVDKITEERKKNENG